MNRDLLNRGVQARNVVTQYVLAFTIIALAIALYFLNKYVIRPLHEISKATNTIGVKQFQDLRVETIGDREINELTTNINRMLDSLSQAHAEVVSARQEAEAANAAKSQFIARVSHELRTPVGGILGINRIIKRQPNLPRSIAELIEMEDLTAQSLLSIVDEILDLSKAESGELTFEKIPFDLRQVIRETMQTIAARLEGKYKPEDKERVELVCDVSPQVPPMLLGDPTKLRQVLINLLGNAVKFTARGNIGLKVEPSLMEGAHCVLNFEVWDTGLGIPEDKLGSVFDPYKQADASTARKFQGTGLGLSIVKLFTEAQGGSVSVKSTQNQGSTFSVSLPLEIEGFAQYLLEPDKTQSAETLSWPCQATIIAAYNPSSAVICKTLSKLGAVVEHIDPFQPASAASLNAALAKAQLLAVSEEALSLPTVSDSVFCLRAKKNLCIAAMVRPSNVKLRDALYKEGVNYVLSTPVMADDLLLAYLGRLPQLGRDKLAADNNAQRLAPSFERKLKVLIVDDISTNRFILEDMLTEAGHEVSSASDGSEMLSRLTPQILGQPGAERFDVVLTDISMEIMDGDEATRRIRELEQKSASGVHVPIIAVTAHALKEEQQRIRQSGVDGVLVKPLYPGTVAAQFESLFSEEEKL